MEIKNTINPYNPYNRINRAGISSKTTHSGTERGKAAPQEESGDSVVLSPEGKLRTAAFTAAMNTPEVRMEKVAKLKEKVESGEYTPDSKDIATKLLKENPGLFRA
ncbi:hypothetical protein FACS1894168_3210 [Deltaproteobacteria bacterium]|nr:hypothetical protein FACS1894168_3210 [Deltaproteobacteria bacterium]